MTDPKASRYVLIIDDDQEDAFALKWAFKQAIAGVEVVHCSEGSEALAFLASKTQMSELPDLVLVDVDMTEVDGFKILEAIRGREETAHLPLLFFSNSGAADEVQRAYRSGANAHLVKPDSMHDLRQMIAAMVQFWLRQASLPDGDDS